MDRRRRFRVRLSSIQKAFFLLSVLTSFTLFVLYATILFPNKPSDSSHRSCSSVESASVLSICSFLSEHDLTVTRLGSEDSDASCIQNIHKQLTSSQVRRPILNIGKEHLPIITSNNERLDFEKSLEWYQQCRLHNCFDFSRCKLSAPFSVYLYRESELKRLSDLDPFIKTSVTNVLEKSSYITFDINAACILLVLVTGTNAATDKTLSLFNKFSLLHSWKDTGKNHILLNLQRNVSSTYSFKNFKISQALIVQSTFVRTEFRPGFDIVAPLLLGKETSYNFKEAPSQIPIRRKYLLSFQGTLTSQILNKFLSNGKKKDTMDSEKIGDGAKNWKQIYQELNNLKKVRGNNFFIDLNCTSIMHKSSSDHEAHGNWILELPLCADKQRNKILSLSIFALIITPDDPILSSTNLQLRLFEALLHGAIPVILGEYIQLPFSEFIVWEKAAIVLPKGRVGEISTYLMSICDHDIITMRHQGWFIWTTYLSSTKAVLDTILATLRTRLSLPARVIPKVTTQLITIHQKAATPNLERTQVGSSFLHQRFIGNNNHTHLNNVHGQSWHTFPGPFDLFPSMPVNSVLPGDAQYTDLKHMYEPFPEDSFRTGKKFQQFLGGNVPVEHFTVVMLMYQRLPNVLSIVEGLNGLKYLNKVLIVWNSPDPPSTDIVWPKIHAPIKVIKRGKNSLNNRFLPYDEIETDAVFHLDDDIHLSHDDILFAFRVWRENRDRIVGFFGRHHYWNSTTGLGFAYSGSGTSCELSIVLTGAAFLHMYYSYLYSYKMPSAIRDEVDLRTNGEDIAMNFLVSHVTRRPPIKVTGSTILKKKIKLGKGGDLSERVHHYKDRSKSIQIFSRVYGYTPLLYTQYRADSVQYKSHRRKRCFRNI